MKNLNAAQLITYLLLLANLWRIESYPFFIITALASVLLFINKKYAFKYYINVLIGASTYLLIYQSGFGKFINLHIHFSFVSKNFATLQELAISQALIWTLIWLSLYKKSDEFLYGSQATTNLIGK